MTPVRKGDLNFWPSFSDIFASLFFIFLILFSVLYVNHIKTSEANQKDVDDLKEFNETTGAKINKKEGTIEFEANLFFDSGKWKLKPKGEEAAHNFANGLSNYFDGKDDRTSKYSLIIEGHTDTEEDTIYNYELSLKRSLSFIDSVKNKLDPELADKLEFIPVGYGETMLAVPTKDETPREENRRVKIRIVAKFDETMKQLANKKS